MVDSEHDTVMTIWNTDKVLELIKGGENQSVEFKLSEVHADSLAKEMVAFANTQGGTLLIGVGDDGLIRGLGDSALVCEERIANISRNNVIPPITVSMQQVEFKQDSVLVVDVQKGIERPYQTRNNQFIIRVGSTNRVATQGELMRLFQQAGAFHYDAVAVPETGLKDLNMAKLDGYFSQYGLDLRAEEEPERVLMNADIMDASYRVTVGGLLIFGLNPQKSLPFVAISIAHYAGITIADELIDKQTVEGTIDFQVDNALAVIRNNIRHPSIIQGTRTIDTKFRYPDKVFRELLVNAVVHRNYALAGSRIRFLLFDDRIEAFSPGRLPNAVNIEKLPIGVSCAVNPILVKFMENLRYIDKLGRGLPMVYQEAKRNGKQVIFEEFGEEFRVILPL